MVEFGAYEGQNDFDQSAVASQARQVIGLILILDNCTPRAVARSKSLLEEA